MTHNHGEVGLQLDEDNALVATDDENGSEDDDIYLEKDSFDTWKYCIVHVKI